jgi:hypothetical protein
MEERTKTAVGWVVMDILFRTRLSSNAAIVTETAGQNSNRHFIFANKPGGRKACKN